MNDICMIELSTAYGMVPIELVGLRMVQAVLHIAQTSRIWSGSSQFARMWCLDNDIVTLNGETSTITTGFWFTLLLAWTPRAVSFMQTMRTPVTWSRESIWCVHDGCRPVGCCSASRSTSRGGNKTRERTPVQTVDPESEGRYTCWLFAKRSAGNIISKDWRAVVAHECALFVHRHGPSDLPSGKSMYVIRHPKLRLGRVRWALFKTMC